MEIKSVQRSIWQTFATPVVNRRDWDLHSVYLGTFPRWTHWRLSFEEVHKLSVCHINEYVFTLVQTPVITRTVFYSDIHPGRECSTLLGCMFESRVYSEKTCNLVNHESEVHRSPDLNLNGWFHWSLLALISF